MALPGWSRKERERRFPTGGGGVAFLPPRSAEAWLWLALVVLFALTYLRPVQEGDYFWHVATGRWIVEHKALPSAEPFKYTYANLDPASHEGYHSALYLKGYWLGDVALWALDAAAGTTGMILLRVAAYAALLAWAAKRFRRAGAGALGLAAAVALAVLLGEYPNERPQLFTFLFFALLLELLEDFETLEGRALLRRGGWLCLVMALWGNLHGAYPLGIALLALYGAGRLLDRFLGRGTLGLREGLLLFAAALSSALNPGGWGIFLDFLGHFGASGEGASHEFVSTIAAWRDFGEVYYSYWLSLALALAVLASAFRRLASWRILILLGVAVLSLTSLRQMVFVPLALPLLAPGMTDLFRGNRLAPVIGLLLLCVGLYGVDKRDMLRLGVDRHMPVEAARFLAEQPVADNLFNFVDWGGYLAYRLPGRKVFLDGRNTVERIGRDHDGALYGPDWRGIFDAWGVNAAILPGVSQHSGRVFPLVNALTQAPDWTLVHSDDSALIFVRNVPQQQALSARAALPKREVYRHILSRAGWLAEKIGDQKGLWLSSGRAHLSLGEGGEAARSFSRALALDPADEEARLGLELARRQGGGGG